MTNGTHPRPARTAEPVRGIVAAPFLAMFPDQSIDYETTARYLGWIARQAPTAIAMNMDASEGPALDRDEQLAVLETAKRAIRGACPLVSGLIAGSTRDAVRFGRELAAAGAEALAIFPPFPTFLGKPVPGEMIERYHRAIAEGVGLPMIAFQFPVAFGPDFPPDTLARLASIPEIIGLKEASFDTTRTIETIEAARALPRRLGILTGSDTFILEAMILGCDGALIGFAGTATAELVAMHAAVARRDYERAQAIWARLGPLARHCWRAPIRDYRPRMKEVLELQGLFPHATVREPQLPGDDAERDEIARLVRAAGLTSATALRAVGE
ncbi:MAG TPA: dihydrodipicolinate synthase family protein [Casimicrobiaceae bacterium]|nr:dihydrodipicolinate synthase family protein [Casimicrobiaceae bacterium]